MGTGGKESSEQENNGTLPSSSNADDQHELLPVGSLRSDQEQDTHYDSADSSCSAIGLPAGNSAILAARYMTFAWLFSALGDRLWAFAIPIMLVDAFPDTLTPVALFTIAVDIAVVSFNPLIGHLVDRMHRLTLLRRSLISEFSCMAGSLISTFFMFHFLSMESTKQSSPSASVILSGVSLSLFSCAASVVSSIVSISFLKDWAVVVSAGLGDHKRAKVNANMQRASLICEILAPPTFGLVLGLTRYSYGPMNTIPILVVLAIKCVGLPIQLALISNVAHHCPALSRGKPIEPKSVVATTNDTSSPSIISRVMMAWTKTKQSWVLYFKQPVVHESMALVLLYANVIQPGPIMTAFLKQEGLGEAALGGVRAAMACIGVLATALAPVILKKFGVIKSSVFTILGMQVCMMTALALFWMRDVIPAGIYLFLLPIIGSRIFLYGFDLVEIQALQLVNDKIRGTVSATEASFFRIASLVSYAATAVVSDPADFFYLMMGGVGAVTCSSALVLIWVRKPSTHAFLASEASESIVSGGKGVQEA